MKKTIKAEEALEDFLAEYVTWISKNVENKEKYLPKKNCNFLWYLAYNRINWIGEL